MKPSIGRIVHYVLDGVHYAAVVTKVWSDICINLSFFANGDSDNPYEPVNGRTSVVLDSTGTKSQSWHWPENVQPTGEVKN